MASLAVQINSLGSNQLEAIERLLNSAHARITRWGSRIVEVDGFEGSVYVSQIADRILKISRWRCHNDNLEPAERICGLTIVGRLQKFYQDTDIEIQKASYFTQFLNWIREFSFNPGEYTARPHIEDTKKATVETAGRNFRVYSKEKFLKEFGVSTSVPIAEHPAVEESMIFCKDGTRIDQVVDRITGSKRCGPYGRGWWIPNNEDEQLYVIKEAHIRNLLAIA